MKIAVVGHVEWVEFLRVERVPAAGAIVHTTSMLQVAAGGGAVAAVQLARMNKGCRFLTVVGNDEHGRRSLDELRAAGVDVHAVVRPRPQRRAITLVDAQRERTIIVIGERMNPHAKDALPWDELADYDAVYLTGADPAGIRAARKAKKLIATSRIVPLLREAAVELDVLIGSARDPGERYDGGLVPSPRAIVRTDGEHGGTYQIGDDIHQYAAVSAQVTGDTYGAGDTFAAALTYALAEGKLLAEALDDAARRAVAVLAHTGPYS